MKCKRSLTAIATSSAVLFAECFPRTGIEIRALRLQDSGLNQETGKVLRYATWEGSIREPTALAEEMGAWALETAHNKKAGPLRGDSGC